MTSLGIISVQDTIINVLQGDGEVRFASNRAVIVQDLNGLYRLVTGSTVRNSEPTYKTLKGVLNKAKRMGFVVTPHKSIDKQVRENIARI